MTADSKEAAVARVMPEHQAWTLVLELLLIAMTLGKSYPHPGSQFLSLSNGRGGLGDLRSCRLRCQGSYSLRAVLVQEARQFMSQR